MNSLNVRLSVAVFREGDRFIAYSPALDLSTSGESYEEAQKNFDEAAQLFLDETSQQGNLEQVLTELGWAQISPSHTWQPPVLIAQEERQVRMPA